MTTIHFIEGIPGSGKSLFAETITTTYTDESVVYYLEHHTKNPIDVTRKAFLRDEELARFVQDLESAVGDECKYSTEDIKPAIDKVTTKINGMNVVSYMNLYFADQRISEKILTLRNKEVCNGLIPKDEYMNLIINLFRAFAQNANPSETYIFEGALFQNIFFDLVGFYNVSYNELKDFYNTLLSDFRHIAIHVHYLKTNDIYNTLHKAAQQRQDKRWLQYFQEWARTSPWGCTKNFTKNDCLISFCSQMQNWSIDLLSDAPFIKYTIYDSDTAITACLKGECLCQI